MVNVSLLVVLYNKKLAESETITTLLNLAVNDLNILIVSNGPSLVEEDDIFFALKRTQASIRMSNFLENRPLSWIYNDFISEYKSDRYIILDDDTSLTQGYFDQLVFSEERYMIGLPKMVSSYDGKQYTPFFNGEFRQDIRGYINGDYNFSVTSGIILSKELVSAFIKKFKTVFDEHFGFYANDNMFFKRLEILANEESVQINYLSNVSILHDFSNIQSENRPRWRVKEGIISDTLAIRYYAPRGYRQIIKQILNKVKEYKFNDCFIILRTYIEGKHPRCRQER